MRDAFFSLAELNFITGGINEYVIEKVGQARVRVHVKGENVAGLALSLFEPVIEGKEPGISGLLLPMNDYHLPKLCLIKKFTVLALYMSFCISNNLHMVFIPFGVGRERSGVNEWFLGWIYDAIRGLITSIFPSKFA